MNVHVLFPLVEALCFIGKETYHCLNSQSKDSSGMCSRPNGQMCTDMARKSVLDQGED
ncbi:predicted protein [Sclerotinia sclerotiorum 1980 UF-70]|uniref:Uncharacterized protein n=1 Tax=Sclerotinia sclerotiorum (strain ATCC 18683 / 1980 / Ss-1) TaxID=665079 RepID=A7EIH7_SCLS1|nr:predicted protein [Sclerotinia sclerotiorum 1980 UF-70]EDO02643.1 predicted protein [Sclerotinia sclerotiorum 1980 UF-70]